MCPLRQAVVLLCALSIAAHADNSALQQYLLDHYQGRTFVVRGFLAGDHLVFNESGQLTKGSLSDDWTANGFVTLNRIQLSHGRVSIEAMRLLVIVEDKEFRLRTAIRPGPPNRDQKPVMVTIEANPGVKDPSPEQVDRVMSKVFLTPQDSLSNLVADYWKPCVPQAIAGNDKYCHFSREILNVLGVESQESKFESMSSRPTDLRTLGSEVDTIETDDPSVFGVGHGVQPPKLLQRFDPEFSEPARAVRYQGTMTLGLILDKEGVPQKLQILSPLGCGLDLKAIQAVSAWRFQPATKDGEPVAVKIAVEVNFHLY